MTQDSNQYEFGFYELSQYAFAANILQELKEERDMEVQALYDDISPTVTSVDYETGQLFTRSFHPEAMALKIIDTRERYEALINKAERKSNLFRIGMETLTDRERDVIQVCYFGRENNLGLSVSHFNKILAEAQKKLCLFLGKEQQKYADNKKTSFTKLGKLILKKYRQEGII